MTGAAALGVAAAGALGTLARWLVALAVPATARLPWATLAVNLVGSFAIGAVIGVMTARGAAASPWRTVLTTGFLGGFTTYSAFALETVQLAQTGRSASALLYVAITLVGGVAACWVGLTLAR
jgi:CrcB protein